MESFFLAETTKYLYLLFDPDNFLNSDGSYGTIVDAKNGECIIESSYIFNTEAHPIDLGALKCCYDLPRESLVKGFDRKKYLGEIAVEKMPVENYENIVQTDESMFDAEKLENELKKRLMEEIMSSLSNSEKKFKETFELQKRFVEMSNREREEFLTESRLKTEIIQKEQDKDIKKEKSDEETEKLETVRLSSNALDQDDANQSKFDEDDLKEEVEQDLDSNITQPVNKRKVDVIKKTIEKNNNSILTDFVKNILKTATASKPRQFDAQNLLEKIKENSHGFTKNDTWTSKYDLLTCKAQAYINRISIMGEFY